VGVVCVASEEDGVPSFTWKAAKGLLANFHSKTTVKRKTPFQRVVIKNFARKANEETMAMSFARVGDVVMS